MIPKKITEFYPYSIHLIYAIIIAESFRIASELIIPIHLVFTDIHSLVQSSELFLVYFLMISGWIGYTRSISRKPHTDTVKGMMRFSLDLVIMFEFFYLLHLIDKSNFSEHFHWVLVAIYLTYLCWDYVKYKEYPQKRNSLEKEAELEEPLYS